MLSLSLVIVALFTFVTTVSAHEHCTDTGEPGASEYGIHHVAHQAQEGMFSGEHNPGHHSGYSSCV